MKKYAAAPAPAPAAPAPADDMNKKRANNRFIEKYFFEYQYIGKPLKSLKEAFMDVLGLYA